jgi:hypothetical protein
VGGTIFCEASHGCAQLALRGENQIAVGMKIRERLAVRDHHHHLRRRHVAVTRIAASRGCGASLSLREWTRGACRTLCPPLSPVNPASGDSAMSLPSQGRRRLQHVLARTLYGRARTLYGRQASLVSRQVSLEAGHMQTVSRLAQLGLSVTPVPANGLSGSHPDRVNGQAEI